MNARRFSFVRLMLSALSAACLIIAAEPARGAQERFAELRAQGTTFTNVVVTGQTAKDLFIRHAGGFATIKLKDLDRATLEQLGVAPPPPPPPPKSSSRWWPSKTTDARAQEAASPASPTTPADPKRARLSQYLSKEYFSWQVLLAIFGGVPLAYVLFCRSCWQLCRRAGSPSDVLVWFPILKRLALFSVTGISWFWFFLGLFIPFVGFCAWILCCIRLCETFNCTRWWTLLMIWPLIGWPAFMYLAWTSRADDNEPAVKYRLAA